MLESRHLKENPALYVFLPIFYLVWSDAVLTPKEIEIIHDTIRRQTWLSEDEKRFLLAYVNPNDPPPSSQLKQWLDRIREIDLNPERNESLADIGVRLAKHHTNGASDKSLREAALSLKGVEESLGIISREAGYYFVNPASRIQIEKPVTESNFNVATLTNILDGNNAALITKVKTLISDERFTLVSTGDLQLYREKVLEWCRILADEGLGSIAYPTRFGGKDDMEGYFALMETLSHHDLSMVIKFGVQFGLFGMSIYFLGTEKHHAKYLRDIGTLALPGCFAMTETGHGSNVRGIETTATYDHARKIFVIHTPNESARKEFIGNAACHGQMATVFAKLIIDGKDYGVNAFVVPVRDKSGNKLPGISIEDCGRKMGLNGVDNGVIYFDKVSIPAENMLDRFATVNAAGNFESPITSDNRRFFTMLGTLVGGRIGIPRAGLSASKTGLAIAIKYSDKRRQFGPEGGPEVPILNYQTHQRRLIPRLADVYALHFSLQHLTKRFMERTEDEMQEIEALAAGLKAFATWNTTQTLQECREACGGKGYMSENRIDDLKNDTDVFTTFEGDNTVLMQLVSKSRLTEFKQAFGSMNAFGILNYVANQAKVSLAEKNPFTVRNTETDHLLDPSFHLSAFTYRERSILASAARRLKSYIDDGMDSFEAFNLCQHHLVQVSFAYIERIILEQFLLRIENTGDAGCKAVLKKLCNLFALNQIEKNKGWYLENGYMEGVKTKAIRKLIDTLCADLRKDAVPLVDAFNIPANCLAPII